MESVVVIGLVLLQASLQSCRTYVPVSLVHDASAEVTVVSPQKQPSKLTQLIPILESVDTPDVKLTKIKKLIPIYNNLNKWRINKQHMVEIMPYKKKGKPLAFIFSGQPSYVGNERSDKQNGVAFNETTRSEAAESDSDELKHKISDLYTGIHGSYSHMSHTNHSQQSEQSHSSNFSHTHNNTTPQVKHNSQEHDKNVVINTRHDYLKTRDFDANESYFDPELRNHGVQSSVELLQTHNKNLGHHKKRYLSDSESYEYDINSSEFGNNKELKQSGEQLHRHITVPFNHAHLKDSANSYSDSNESDLNSNELNPYINHLELFRRRTFLHHSKHAHLNHDLENHHISNPDSISDSNESDLHSSGPAKSGISESVTDSSESESESSISDFSPVSSEFDLESGVLSSESIPDTDSPKSHFHNSRQFDLHAHSEINTPALDSNDSDQNLDSNNESNTSLFDFNLADSGGSDTSSEPSSDSNSDSRSNESNSNSDSRSNELNSNSVSESRLLEPNEPYLVASGSISEASESASKSGEFDSKFRESLPENSESILESGESYLEADDSFIQSSESTAESSAFISEYSESVSESKDNSKYSESFSETDEPVSESSESVLKPSESVFISSESNSESNESVSKSKEPVLESNDSVFVSNESKLKSGKSNLKLCEPKSNESLQTVEVVPQLMTYSRRNNFDDDKSADVNPCKIVGKEIETELSRGKKSYKLSFVFNK